MKESNVLQSLKYSLFLIFHPFKGFWNLKHEKRGNLIAANILYFLFVLLNILSTQMAGNIYKIQNRIDINSINVAFLASSLIIPIVFYCLANWAVTTLLDGEGTIKDIYISNAFTLTPYIILSIPLIIMNNLFTIQEMTFYTFVVNLSVIWVALLILIGSMTLHQYTILKTIGTVMLSIFGVAVIIAVGLLFISLVSRISNFVLAIYTELKLRY